MTSHDDLHRDIGRMDAEIGGLKRDVGELKTDVKIILETLNTAKGGWKTLLMVGAAAGAMGAFIAKIAPFFPIR